jgi:predicted ribosomally synthesized peptide with SipW-like signal peptide
MRSRGVLMGSMIVIVLVGLLVGATTVAYFNDVETSSGNTFTAGTLDLKVGEQDDPNVVYVTIDNIKPGWSGEYSWTLKNVGTLTGYLLVKFYYVDYENGQTEPEALVDPTGGDPGEGNGELSSKIWIDKIEFQKYVDYQWKTSRLYEGPSRYEYLNQLKIGVPYYAKRGEHMANPECGVLRPGETVTFYMKLKLDTSVGNEIQSDSVVLNIEFILDQRDPNA